jgi:hypothetical protein
MFAAPLVTLTRPEVISADRSALARGQPVGDGDAGHHVGQVGELVGSSGALRTALNGC